MKKFFTRILAVACCLAASLTASAQYSKVFEQYPRTGYETDAVTYKMTEIAAQLDTDTATLVKALATIDTNYDVFYLEGAEDKSHNEGANGYYLDLEGKKCDWGDENSRWFISPRWDVEEDTFGFVVGQHSNRMQGGEETGVAQLVLAMNGKKVTFDISLKIKSLELPEATDLLSKLTIVDRKSATVEQWARTSTKADADTIDFKGVAAALGIDPELLSVGLSKIIYATKADEGDDQGTYGFKTDTLTNAFTASDPGFWFANPFDGYDEFVSVSSTNGLFFAESFAYDPETEQLTYNIGQQGGKFPIIIEGLEPIDHAMAKVYFVYGSKAVELAINLKIVERDVVPFSEMNEVGSEDVNLSQYPTTSYESVSFSVDLDAIAALLGCDAGDISLWAPDGEGGITDDASAGNQGFWFNKDGVRATWGASCGIFVENPTDGDFSKFNVGQYPNTFEGGETGIATLYFVFGVNYYTVNVKMEIKVKEGPGVEFESVAVRAANIQIVPSGSYDVEMRYDISPAELEELIGTNAPTLYAQKAPAEANSPWAGEFDDRYSCDPKPGFWMSTEGYRSTWGTDGTNWGFSFLSDGDPYQFQFFQMPNKNEVGDEYNAVIYLVNEETGKMITYNMNIKFVSTVVPQAKVVGQESLPLLVKANTAVPAAVDFTNCLEALGLENVSELLAVPSLCVLLSDGNFSEAALPSAGAAFNEAGYLDESDKLTETKVNIDFTDDAEQPKVMTFTVDEWTGEWDADTRITTKLGFQVEDKIYVFNLVLLSEEAYTGIAETKGSKAPAAIFDLSGRRVEKAQRGIFIVNGKKVVR